MKTIEFMDIIRSLGKPVFTTADVARITGKKDSYVGLYLHRIKGYGKIEEIERGKFAMPGTDPMLIASNMIFPSYISFLSGLIFINLTNRISRTVFVACAKSKAEIRKGEYSIRFVKLSGSKMFGYRKERYYENKFIIVGEPEKIIVDSLFLPEYCPIDETFNALMEGEFDAEKLLEYGIRMESIVVLKRLGYLLELKGIDVHEKLRGRLNQRYDLLNPLLQKEGIRDKKWKLVINENFEV
jgi:predicted transcriptional regulator of viral defense system